MDRYICRVCANIYDPAAGDYTSNIPPGTPFENLPQDWVCPVCGSGKDKYEFLSQERYERIFPEL